MVVLKDAMDPNKKPKPRFSAGSEVLQSLFENGKSPLSDQFLRWKLWAAWPEVVGPTISQNAEPVGYQRGVLFLWVKNSSWMQQMTFMKDPIKETINQKLGRKFVHSIRFTLDRHAVPQEDTSGLKELIQKIVPESQDED